jgi:hypothetical protein
MNKTRTQTRDFGYSDFPIWICFGFRISCFGFLLLVCTSCSTSTADAPRALEGPDEKLGSVGTIEVTARLVEVPEGAIFKRDLYNYVTILKYEVLEVHRGQLEGKTIYAGHYNPFKPRPEAANPKDPQVAEIGGDLRTFEAGQVHRMAIVPLDDQYMGPIVNKYFGRDIEPRYFALWTNLVSR